jgi:ribonucleotide reductase beta subunit family protein with ferritin-like domain
MIELYEDFINESRKSQKYIKLITKWFYAYFKKGVDSEIKTILENEDYIIMSYSIRRYSQEDLERFGNIIDNLNIQQIDNYIIFRRDCTPIEYDEAEIILDEFLDG